MSQWLNLPLYLFLLSCLMFSFFFKHLLMTLISLEFIMINAMYMYYTITLMIKINLYLMSIFLTLMICESILGLSIMIYLIRLKGNDYFKSLNIMLW